MKLQVDDVCKIPELRNKTALAPYGLDVIEAQRELEFCTVIASEVKATSLENPCPEICPSVRNLRKALIWRGVLGEV